MSLQWFWSPLFLGPPRGLCSPISKVFTHHKTLGRLRSLHCNVTPIQQVKQATSTTNWLLVWDTCTVVDYFVQYYVHLCIYLYFIVHYCISFVHLCVLLCIQKSGQWTRFRIIFLLRCVIVTFSWKYTLFLSNFVFNSVLGNIITSSWSKSIHYFIFSNHRILEVNGRTYIQLFERKDNSKSSLYLMSLLYFWPKEWDIICWLWCICVIMVYEWYLL